MSNQTKRVVILQSIATHLAYHRPGDVLELPEAHADSLIASGLAGGLDKPLPPPALLGGTPTAPTPLPTDATETAETPQQKRARTLKAKKEEAEAAARAAEQAAAEAEAEADAVAPEGDTHAG